MNTRDVLRILIDINRKLFRFPQITIELFERTDLLELEEMKEPKYFQDKIPPFRFEIMSENHFKNEYFPLSESEKAKYISRSYRIVYPDNAIEDVIEYTKNVKYCGSNTSLYDKTLSLINYVLGSYDNKNLCNIMILYDFLHEIGHYDNLTNKNYMPYTILNDKHEDEKADEFAAWWLGKLKLDGMLKLFFL